VASRNVLPGTRIGALIMHISPAIHSADAA
jgi:hypothetical protein